MAASKLQDLIDETRKDQGRKGDAIVRAARELQAKLETVIEAVEAGRQINSLGEIQGRGSSFDILCAQWMDAAQHVAALEWAATADHEGTGN